MLAGNAPLLLRGSPSYLASGGLHQGPRPGGWLLPHQMTWSRTMTDPCWRAERVQATAIRPRLLPADTPPATPNYSHLPPAAAAARVSTLPPLRLVHYLSCIYMGRAFAPIEETRPRPRPIHETTSHPGAGRAPKSLLLLTLRKRRRGCVRRVIVVKGFFTTTTRIIRVCELTSCWFQSCFSLEREPCQ